MKGKPRRIILLVFCACLLIWGCFGPRMTWSAESRSPDGEMIATAELMETSGIGTGDPGTSVYLNFTSGPQPRVIIFAFAQASAGDSSEGRVRMTWITPTDLEITYTGPQTIDFQAIKCRGVDITIRDRTLEASPTDKPY
jgi:hypothetical protein